MRGRDEEEGGKDVEEERDGVRRGINIISDMIPHVGELMLASFPQPAFRASLYDRPWYDLFASFLYSVLFPLRLKS